VVVDIVLPAVLGLVLVGESSIESYAGRSMGLWGVSRGFEVPAAEELAIEPSPHQEGSMRTGDIPVTNLKGLTSRSLSDMFADCVLC
jgi:hypothetical protein